MAINVQYSPVTAALEAAKRGGEGQQFRERFQMGQQLIDQGLRARAIDNAAEANRGEIALATRRQFSQENSDASRLALADKAQRFTQSLAAAQFKASQQQDYAKNVIDTENLSIHRDTADAAIEQQKTDATRAQANFEMAMRSQDRQDKMAELAAAREGRLSDAQANKEARGMSVADLSRAVHSTGELIKQAELEGDDKTASEYRGKMAQLTSHMLDAANAQQKAQDAQQQTQQKQNRLATEIVDSAYEKYDNVSADKKWGAIRAGLQGAGMLGMPAPYEVKRRVAFDLDRVNGVTPDQYEKWFNFITQQMGFGEPK